MTIFNILTWAQDMANKNFFNYIDLGLAIAFAVLLVVIAVNVSKRKVYIPIISISFAAVIAAIFCEFYACAIMVGFLMVLFFAWFSSNYSSNLKQLFKKMHDSSKKINGLAEVEKQKLLDVIEKTVIDLSSTKTGAIITFETSENLDEFIKNGVKVNAPVSNELLKTIFFVGTPLHDGAVIIRGNSIEAASVFYTPSIKAMSGKYGARHRAAIGFSQSHEAVTIVVSEETGKISFAIQGDLVPATHDTFRKRLESYLDY